MSVEYNTGKEGRGVSVKVGREVEEGEHVVHEASRSLVELRQSLGAISGEHRAPQATVHIVGEP